MRKWQDIKRITVDDAPEAGGWAITIFYKDGKAARYTNDYPGLAHDDMVEVLAFSIIQQLRSKQDA